MDETSAKTLRTGRGAACLLAMHLTGIGCGVAGRGSTAPPASREAGDLAAAAPAPPAAVDVQPDAAAPVVPAPALSAAAPAAAPIDRDNRGRPPSTSAELQERAQHLFEAIVRLEPKLADDFFFPRAPFLPLKDVNDPGRYFDQLLATYHRDIAALHTLRRDWSSASFVSFTLGSEPGWVAPGKEYNKIGYYRTFRGKLRYRIEADAGGKAAAREIDVGTVISWDGRWYVTHLTPLHH